MSTYADRHVAQVKRRLSVWGFSVYREFKRYLPVLSVRPVAVAGMSLSA